MHIHMLAEHTQVQRQLRKIASTKKSAIAEMHSDSVHSEARVDRSQILYCLAAKAYAIVCNRLRRRPV